jgi:hypothetical protein
LLRRALFRCQLEEGGFSTFREEGAKREYSWIKGRALKKKGKRPPLFESWARGKIRENEMSFLTGDVAASMIRLGNADDYRVKRA